MNESNQMRENTSKPVDFRFGPYVTIYNNLDILLWSIPPLLLGTTVLGFALFGDKLTDPDISLTLLTHNRSIGVALVILGLLYGLGALSIWRIRRHHTLMGTELKKLEPTGYFHKRAKIVKCKWLSAPHAFITVFTAIAIISLIYGCFIFFTKENSEMKKEISQRKVGQFKIYEEHESMANGELRFRLMGDDGSGYIRTIAGDKKEWQCGHSHSRIIETYIVQKGFMILAIDWGEPEFYTCEPNSIVTIKPGVVHKVYLPTNAIIHTVKHGDTSKKDWKAEREFDKEIAKLSKLSEEKLKNLGTTVRALDMLLIEPHRPAE